MDMFLFGITISTSAITIVTLKLAIETKYVARSFVLLPWSPPRYSNVAGLAYTRARV
jgi:hypothetical protein